MFDFKHGGTQQSAVSRRGLFRAAAAATAFPALARATAAFARDKLAGSGQVVVFSWGGPFTKNLRKHIYEPFTEATGIRVVDVITDVAEPPGQGDESGWPRRLGHRLHSSLHLSVHG